MMLSSCFRSVLFLAAAGVLVASPTLPPVQAGESNRARIEQLRQELEPHDTLYYREGDPEISDEAYDQLKGELQQRTDVERFPAGAVDAPEDPMPIERSRWRHREPMLSLNKAYTSEDLAAFTTRVAMELGTSDVAYIVEPKIDGIAISLVFEAGRLVAAATRGDGHNGEDITAVFRTLNLVPLQLAAGNIRVPGLIELRGELFIPFAGLERINTARRLRGDRPFSHSRQAVAGVVRAIVADPDIARELALAIHGLGAVEPASAAPLSQRAMHQALAEWGVPTVQPWRDVVGPTALAAAVTELADLTYPFPRDGVVIKVDAREEQARLGASATAPRWAVARKFRTEGGRTNLRRVRWQIGRTGVLTPIAEFDPVEVGGAVLSRCTLHGPVQVRELDLHVGDHVMVERTGGVIPVLAAVDATRRHPGSETVAVPTVCPDCDRELTEDGQVWCLNVRCPGRVSRTIEHFAGSSGVAIRGLGPATIDRLVEAGALRTPADVYRLEKDDLPGSNGEQVLAAIEESRHAPWWRVVTGLGLPEVGPVTARQLAAAFPTANALAEATLEELQRGAGASGRMTAVHAWLQDPENRAVLLALGEARYASSALTGAGP